MTPLPERKQKAGVDAILVTGGAGFVGSTFVRMALAGTPCKVAVVDSLVPPGGSRDNLGDAFRDARFSFFETDIRDSGRMAAILKGVSPRWVVNFADIARVETVGEGTPAFLETNVVGSLKLLEVVRAHFDSLAPEEKLHFRFLQVSTDEVYGSLPSIARFSEQSPYSATSLYGASKVAGEQFALAYHARCGLPIIITNSSNNYGPRQSPEMLIPRWALDLLAGRSIPVYGEGGNARDWLYVEDYCEGILAALKQGFPGERYNFGSDAEFRDSEVLDRICQILERQVPPGGNPSLKAKGVARYGALKTIVKDHRGKARHCSLLSLKARKDLGWRPRHVFEAGLAKAVQWYIDQREWYESIRASHAVECTK